MKKILFISHNAYRAGAQLLLLQLLIYFKKQSNFEFEILLKDSGDLYSEFAEIAPTHLWNVSLDEDLFFNRFFRLKEKIRRRKILGYLKKQSFDLIYSNTITNGHLLHDLSALNLPVITHVHELNNWIDKCGEQNLQYTKKYSKKFIAASAAVKNTLIERVNIPENQIELIYEFVDVEKVEQKQEKGELRKLLNISENSLIVGASGYESWRKGMDLFIPIALKVLKSIKCNVHFVWIGGYLNDEISFDLKTCGYQDRIHFIDHLSDANRLFCDFDMFLMLSREDPFPVVNLEVGVLGKPILCFENSGGTPELIGNIGEAIVPYLDVCAMADKTIHLLENRALREVNGSILMEKIKNNYDINIILKKVLACIQDCPGY